MVEAEVEPGQHACGQALLDRIIQTPVFHQHDVVVIGFVVRPLRIGIRPELMEIRLQFDCSHAFIKGRFNLKHIRNFDDDGLVGQAEFAADFHHFRSQFRRRIDDDLILDPCPKPEVVQIFFYAS